MLKKLLNLFQIKLYYFILKLFKNIKFYDININILNQQNKKIVYKNENYTFYTPNSLNLYRVDTFSTKEPETLEWIDLFDNNSILWDIGANIGLYSIYAAKTKNMKVFSFEPSIFNLELLAKNIWVNNLTNNITVIPLPLTDHNKISKLQMSSIQLGGALSTFGEKYGYDGKDINSIFEYSTIGLSMNDSVRLLNIPQPDYIKIDVDGIEHLILKGGDAILKNVKSLLIEIDDVFEKQVIDTNKYLIEAGLVLSDKKHAEIYAETTFFNQIWVRP